MPEPTIVVVGAPQDWDHVRINLPDHPMVDDVIPRRPGDMDAVCQICNIAMWIPAKGSIEKDIRTMQGEEVHVLCLVCAVIGYRLRHEMGLDTDLINLAKEYGDEE